ncbi:hypothetical protein Nepgr_012776 [Nepenthes gracilis]|uniref:Uncharacterized protein n=1 Tax=Nepenthes gracilis TaxID=150966 RepID=A0AAD3XNN7_NEPGR|nr:hypothetical protein Nepgr_012776 [Nepenthes gracilis]
MDQIHQCLLSSKGTTDSNCLRLVECISGVDTRGKQLKSVVAFQVLKTCFHEEVTDAQDVLRLLISTNLKTKNSTVKMTQQLIKCGVLSFVTVLAKSQTRISGLMPKRSAIELLIFCEGPTTVVSCAPSSQKTCLMLRVRIGDFIFVIS